MGHDEQNASRDDGDFTRMSVTERIERREKENGEPAGKGLSTVDLSEAEEEEVESRGAPRAIVLFETIRREGVLELRRPVISLIASGLAAGLSMGMSLAGEAIAKAAMPDKDWAHLIYAFGYTLGFIIVVLGRQQLFTENTITVILPLLDGPKKLLKLGLVARVWSIVLVTNLLGAAAFAFFVSHTHAFSPKVMAAMHTIGMEAVKLDFWTIVERGIVAGWLVALMVWLLPGADTTRLFVILIITYVVGVGGFSHIIAGSVEAFYVVFTGDYPIGTYFTDFLLPVFIGNVLGGTALTAMLNYGQVIAEASES